MALLYLVLRNYKKSFRYLLIYLNYYYLIKVAFRKEHYNTLIISISRGNIKRIVKA
jgi:hypothetical protein